MRLNNGTSDPVEYEQSGGSTPEEEHAGPAAGEEQDVKKGTIEGEGTTGDFVPAGTAPFQVRFRSEGHRWVTSCWFSDPDATVQLWDNWAITVSSGCD